jgi:hypothetical protein
MSNEVVDNRISGAVELLDVEVKATTGINLSDYEKAIITEGIVFAKSQTVNNYAAVMDAMEKLVMLESEYNYLIYSLTRYWEQLTLEFRSRYDPLFASLTRAGRPNQAAVEAEAMSKDGNKLLQLKNKVNRLEQVINYLKSEMLILRSKSKVFDAKRSNTF